MLQAMPHYRAAACLAALTVICVAGSAFAAVVPFTESFDTNDAGWLNNTSGTPTYSATGGPGGAAFISESHNFVGNVNNDTIVLFRGNSSNNASGDAFVGDWITDGVSSFSFDLRHNFSAPVTLFARFASPAGFPGGVAVAFAPVTPNTWTNVSFDISPSNPAFVSFEGSNFNTVFSNIGIVQVGVFVTPGVAGVDQNADFDLTNVSIVPEPTSLALIGLGGLMMLRRRSR